MGSREVSFKQRFNEHLKAVRVEDFESDRSSLFEDWVCSRLDEMSGFIERKKAIPTGALLSLKEIEANHMRLVLSSTARLEDAAKILGINTTTLWRKRREYQIYY
jgi:transcriptional regulator with PAS, ATPase and Fis domain